jgi:hypothetical protein
VDPALALGDRHPLHAVRTAFELEVLPGVVAADHEGDLVDTAEVARVVRQRLDAPAVPGCVGEVHVVEVAGEQVGLLAALGTADLDDDGSAGVRVTWEEQLAQAGLGRRDLVERRVDLGLHRRPIDRIGAGEQLVRGVEVARARAQRGVGLHDRLELAIPLGHDPELVGVGGGRRIGQARLELAELVGDGGEAGVDTGIEHDGPRLPAPGHTARRDTASMLSCNDSGFL